MISLSEYLSFILWMVLGFGLFFQLPVVVIGLTRFGVITVRQIAQYRRHVILGIVVVAAFMTPGPDVFSQMIMALPSYLLFEVSLLIARRLSP